MNTLKQYWFIWVPILVVGIVLTIKETRHYVIWDNWGEVEEGVAYRSGRLKHYQLEEAIEEHQIQTVVNLTHRETGRGAEGEAAEQRLVESLGVKYVKRNWPGDGVVPIEEVEEIYAIVSDPENQPVLWHCARGTQRSGTVGAMWRIKEGWTREQIRDEMVSYRYRVSENAEMEALVDEMYQRFSPNVQRDEPMETAAEAATPTTQPAE